MMFSRLMIALLLGTLVAGGPISAALAQQPSAFRFAVLDMERVRGTAAAVKSIRSQLETYMQSFRAETQREEQQLRTAQEELARKRTILSQEAFAAERQKLEQKLGEAQQRLQRRQQSINQVRGEAMQTVLQSLQEVVQGIATERQLTLIVRRRTTVYADPRYDITDEVLQRLDARLPSVKVGNPG